MPHTVFNVGDQIADARVGARRLVAGIEPARGIVIGGSREPKPALMILDCWAEPVNISTTGGATTQQETTVNLLLSQEGDLNPAFFLPVAHFRDDVTRISASGEYPSSGYWDLLFRAQGSIWAPRYVGVGIATDGGYTVFDVDVHLDWEVVEIDWWDWFTRWNQLEAFPDGSLTDGDREYA